MIIPLELHSMKMHSPYKIRSRWEDCRVKLRKWKKEGILMRAKGSQSLGCSCKKSTILHRAYNNMVIKQTALQINYITTISRRTPLDCRIIE